MTDRRATREASGAATAEIQDGPRSSEPVSCTCGSTEDSRDDGCAELFQRTLLATYDIEVEFQRRLNHLDRLIGASGGSEDAADLAERLELAVMLCPLRLSLDERCVETTRSGSMEGTGEPVYQFVYRIPYEGDTELWSLSPASAPIAAGEAQPAGEIYRQRLIIVVYACTSAEADGWMNHTISSVDFIIRAQAREVKEFNESLPGLIWRKLVHHRAEVDVVRGPTQGTLH